MGKDIEEDMENTIIATIAFRALIYQDIFLKKPVTSNPCELHILAIIQQRICERM